MRQSRTVSLGAGRFAEVMEARALHLRRLLELLPQLAGADPLTLIARHGPELVGILEDCVRLPDAVFADLSLSEVETVAGAWWSLHTDFFVQALARLGLVERTAAPNSSNGPSPSSPAAATPPPGTTAGATS